MCSGSESAFPGHGQVVLGRNFRSRSEILNAAVACVSQNERRTAKALIAVRGDGGRVHVRAFQSEYHEAHWIARTTGQALAAGVVPADILVLVRASYATGAVQTALAQAGVPHRVLGSLGLYERSEIRDALAYLTLLVNPPTRRRSGGRCRRRSGERGWRPSPNWSRSPASDTTVT
jgi:DNA helicase II / ATP-dependent DNA helicase PcrA